MARAMRIGRRGVTVSCRRPYWRVAVPVIVGWTEQMYWYVPAARAGTS